MIREEGADVAACVAVMNYIGCAAMFQQQGLIFNGHHWSRWRLMKRRVEWLYVEDEFKADVEKLFTTISEEAPLCAPAGGVTEAAGSKAWGNQRPDPAAALADEPGEVPVIPVKPKRAAKAKASTKKAVAVAKQKT